MARVAVIGSGISGLSVACGLTPWAEVTLFEAENYFGGHTHTVDITLEGRTHGVDTGFLVYNERTYPNLIRLFSELGVQTAVSDMSFSVQVPDIGLEWSGRDMNTVFAQRRNIVRPGFLRMLGDIVRFNRITTGIAEREAENELDQPICEFLAANRFSCEFRDWYFLPMICCIWSCPTDQMLRFPIATMIRFCHNHGLLQIAHRPRWFTVTGGAKHYVAKMLTKIPDARLKTPVRHVHRHVRSQCRSEVLVTTDVGSERFDHVVFACHSDQSLALLANPSSAEREILGSITYQPNRAVLHTDTSVLPRRRQAWAAWNYERAIKGAREQTSVCLHYLINRLQPLPFETSVVVSLNPVRDPRPGAVHGEFEYSHPVFDQAAIAAQRRVPSLQGVGNTWYCGAWTRYGFHEDGLTSGLAVVEALKQKIAAPLVASEAA
ncbi:MAG: NAD(P)-binding protein [Burkholderiales bacterium]|nr:NAD(P)-binding protein [Burkholderiales bacterium]